MQKSQPAITLEMPKILKPKEKAETLRLGRQRMPKYSISKQVGISRPTVSLIIKENAVNRLRDVSPNQIFHRTKRAKTRIEDQLVTFRKTFEWLKAAVENPLYGNIVQSIAAENDFDFSGGRKGVEMALHNLTKDHSTEHLKEFFVLLAEMDNSFAKNLPYSDTPEENKKNHFHQMTYFIKYANEFQKLGLSFDDIKKVASLGEGTLRFTQEYRKLVEMISDQYNLSSLEAMALAVRTVNEFYISKELLVFNKKLLEIQSAQIARNKTKIEEQERQIRSKI